MYLFFAIFVALSLYCGDFPGWFDSAELALAVDTLGISHPPGQPFYVLCAKVFTYLIPFGTNAFRVAAFSSFCATLSLWTVSRIYMRLGHSPWASYFVAALLLCVPSFAMQSTRIEVYMLAQFLSLWIVHEGLCFEKERVTKYLMRACFLWGLLFCTHSYIAIASLLSLLSLAFLYRIKNIKTFLGGFLCAAIPIVTLYIGLYVRALQNPVLNWEGIHSWKSFWHFFTAKAYAKSFGWMAFDNIPEFLNASTHPYIALALCMAVCIFVFRGLLASFAKAKTPALVFGFSLLSLCFVELSSNNPDSHGYTLPFLSMALILLLYQIKVQWIFILFFSVFPFSKLESQLSSSGSQEAEFLSARILDIKAPSRIALTGDHWYFPAIYRQQALNEHPEHLLLNEHMYPLTWYQRQHASFFSSSLPIYFESKQNLPHFIENVMHFLDVCLQINRNESFEVNQSICAFELKRIRPQLIRTIGIDRTIRLFERYLVSKQLILDQSHPACEKTQDVSLPFQFKNYEFLPKNKDLISDLAMMYVQCGWPKPALDLTKQSNEMDLRKLRASLEFSLGDKESAKETLHASWFERWFFLRSDEIKSLDELHKNLHIQN